MAMKSGSGAIRSKNKGEAQKKTLKKKKKKGGSSELDELLQTSKSNILDEMDTMFGEDDASPNDAKKVFEKQFKQLKDNIDASNTTFNASHTSRIMTRAMLNLVVDLIPIAEQAYRRDKKEGQAYAINALLNQARELNTDLKMMQDVEGQSEFITQKLIDPVFNSMTQQVLASFLDLKHSIDTELGTKAPKKSKRIKTHIDGNLRLMGNFLAQSKDKVASDIGRYLSGDPTLLGTSKTKTPRR